MMDGTYFIFHPPCTHLALCGAKHFEEKRKLGLQKQALNFVKWGLQLDIPHICLENPKSIISTHIRKPDQIIHPWQYGHGETKETWLWLKNLPLLKPTKILYGKENRQDKCFQLWRNTPNHLLGHLRSRTYAGIADAMAEQWGDNILNYRDIGGLGL